uniref:Family with sequence similarity 107 member B n=1 Tax=Canis lupus familiaris TaxID=9615 RepID=A0A8C0NB58_CANLF
MERPCPPACLPACLRARVPARPPARLPACLRRDARPDAEPPAPRRPRALRTRPGGKQPAAGPPRAGAWPDKGGAAGGLPRRYNGDRRPVAQQSANGPSEDTDLKDTYLIPRNIMAEPDYIEDDNPELIRPQKLVNPVKTSRNHQDLHRELLMNQKRGLAPQNKPELQKVMEKRKRDQVIKQKEEEAQKKKSDLEIELLKRQQKLEQQELEKQKLQEEQENAPEFVKVKGNLRRTGQEVAQVQES